MIKGVVFDLGNTLLRFEGDWDALIEASRVALLNFLLGEGFSLDADRFRRILAEEHDQDLKNRQRDHIERPTVRLLRRVMEQFGYVELSDELVSHAMRHFYAVSEASWLPKPSTQDLLWELKTDGKRLALISNAGNQGNADRLLRKANIQDFFDPLLISSEVGIRKPHVEIFQRVLRHWELPADNVVMVGDSLREDIFGAQRVGMHQIWLKEDVDTAENRRISLEIVPELVATHLGEIRNLIMELSLRSQRNLNDG